jgi:L-threonylcarbamoyladenylate synthase
MIVSAQTPEEMKRALELGRKVILEGGGVACPTESFYGLAVDPSREEAVRRLFALKRRPERNPILLLIPSLESLPEYVVQIPPVARLLMGEFWPGGLTLVFEASARVSPLLTAGTGKIALRLSSHPVARGLAGAVGGPITGTSANISGSPPCSSPGQVLEALAQGVDLIIDGGETPGGIGSTILDIAAEPPRILRSGMVQDRQLKRFIGSVRLQEEEL